MDIVRSEKFWKLPVPGWDPVILHSNNDGFGGSLSLKTSRTGKYPVVVCCGFDHCQQQSEFMKSSPLPPEKRPEAFVREQRIDLCGVIRFMYSFLQCFDKDRARPLFRLPKSFHQGSTRHLQPENLNCDAREMVRRAREAF